VLRVNGSTEFTRSIGASSWQNKEVISIPEITKMKLNPEEDSFFVVGSDGIFNTITKQGVVDIVKGCNSPQEAANMLSEIATNLRDSDNATALVVQLYKWGKFCNVNYTESLKHRKIDHIFGIRLEPDNEICTLIDQNAETIQILQYIFSLFDLNNDKLISVNDILCGAPKIGKTLSYGDAGISLMSIDTNLDKRISFEEFCQFFA